MVTRRQHYVSRHYIEMWLGKDGLASCLRDQKIFQTNPINIMVERDFYKLQKLTREDIFILQEFVKKTTSPHLRNDLPPGTSPLSKLDLGPFEVHSMV